jgi:hypothetical protein
LTVFIIAHLNVLVKGFSKLFLFFILETPVCATMEADKSTCLCSVLAFPLDCNIIISDSFGFVYWQNAQRIFNILFYFVQIAGRPGAERLHQIKGMAQHSGVHLKNFSKWYLL